MPKTKEIRYICLTIYSQLPGGFNAHVRNPKT